MTKKSVLKKPKNKQDTRKLDLYNAENAQSACCVGSSNAQCKC